MTGGVVNWTPPGEQIAIQLDTLWPCVPRKFNRAMVSEAQLVSLVLAINIVYVFYESGSQLKGI